MEPQVAYQTLLRSPKSFLQTRVVSINGGSTNGTTAYVIGSAGHNTGTGFEKYKVGAGFIGGVSGTTYSFQANNVRMIPSTEAYDHKSITPYSMPFGTPIMLTGQLSGCCFCIASNGANLLLAHVQPGGTRGDGLKIQSDIDKEGRFAGFPNLKITTWGAKDYGQGGKASVIGICSTGAWKIYGQVQDGAASRVVRVDEIL